MKLLAESIKNNFTEEVLVKLMKVARLEYLILKADFSPSILEIDEAMKEKLVGRKQRQFTKNDR